LERAVCVNPNTDCGGIDLDVAAVMMLLDISIVVSAGLLVYLLYYVLS